MDDLFGDVDKGPMALQWVELIDPTRLGDAWASAMIKQLAVEYRKLQGENAILVDCVNLLAEKVPRRKIK